MKGYIKKRNFKEQSRESLKRKYNKQKNFCTRFQESGRKKIF